MVFDEYWAAVFYVPTEYEPRLRLRTTYDVNTKKQAGDFMWFPTGGDWEAAERFHFLPIKESPVSIALIANCQLRAFCCESSQAPISSIFWTEVLEPL